MDTLPETGNFLSDKKLRNSAFPRCLLELHLE
jgi:hypothetical protein